ncbi:MAG: hypothetical protein NT075_32635 [Chloroflexi bacterium]|nr:hypothetical protein [Chloroflexota bacterium]
MSDRPKPGKDKDLRCIRQAIEETDKFYSLLSGGIEVDQLPEFVSFISEAMLLTIDQLDLLDQMLGDVTITPTRVIENNRCLRNLLRSMLQKNLSHVEQISITRMIQAIGDQLKALLIVKEIRSND